MSPVATLDEAAVREAYQHCEEVTRTQARNFSYGIRLLPGGKRRALSAVYAFARRVDDIGDGTLPGQEKLAALGEARAAVTALDASGEAPPGDLVLVALGDAARRYPIPLAAFGELIDGCEADVRGTSYASFPELERYCRCVAGSIGRLSLGVFGCRDPGVAAPLADALGVALQLTNILRDIREDLSNGRVYLPAEDLERYGCALWPERVDTLDSDRGLEELMRFEAQRALGWYARGMRLLPMLDRRSAACTGAMAGIYLRLLEQIAADPAAALRERQSLSGRAKAGVAARALGGVPPRVPMVAQPGPARPVPAASGPAAGDTRGRGTGTDLPGADNTAHGNTAVSGTATADTVTGDAAAGDTPTSDTPTSDTPTGNTAAGDTVTRDAAAGDTRTGGPAAGDTAAGNTVTSDATVGDATVGGTGTGSVAAGDTVADVTAADDTGSEGQP